jgi:hypothetical protein
LAAVVLCLQHVHTSTATGRSALLRLTALVACGTRTVTDAVFGPTDTSEVTYAPELGRSLRAGMILLLDRNFAARDLIITLACDRCGSDGPVENQPGHAVARCCWTATIPTTGGSW